MGTPVDHSLAPEVSVPTRAIANGAERRSTPSGSSEVGDYVADPKERDVIPDHHTQRAFSSPAYRRIERLIADERCVILDGGIATELQRLRPLKGESPPDPDLWGTWALYR